MTWMLLVVALMVVGVGLLAIELLIIPGFGLIGILGLAGVVGSIAAAFARLPAPDAALTLGTGLLGSALLFWLVSKTQAVRSMVLDTQMLGKAVNPALLALGGRQGLSLTPLRPSGKVSIDGQPIDAVTNGEYVPAEQRVKVVKVEGNRVVVARDD